MKGRPAAIPAVGYQPPARLFVDDDRCVVRFVSEDGRASKDFDFSRIPLVRDMQFAFAVAFEHRTGPASGIKAIKSAYACYYGLRSFGTYLAGLPAPPRRSGDLEPRHLDGYRHHHRGLRSIGGRVVLMERTLRYVDGLSDEFTAALRASGPRPKPINTGPSYTTAELGRVMAAARNDAHRIAARIRANREFLQRWRDGQVPEADHAAFELGGLLDHIERTGDVARIGDGDGYRPPVPAAAGRVFELVSRVHLRWPDATPFLVLLIGMTAQNAGTILDAPAASHDPNGDTGGLATAIVDLNKPRRGPHRHMPVTLTELPDWLTVDAESIATVADRAEMRSPLGVFLALRELTEPARQALGCDRLVVTWGHQGWRVGQGRPDQQALGEAVRAWGQRAGLRADPPADGTELAPLVLTLPRLRLTALEHRQQAVAHTEQTLANEYLGRDRGNLAAYQQLVARVLNDQVAKAKASALMPTLTVADITEAQQQPEAVAARFGLDTVTLKRLLAGELDTVLGACTDHLAGPHAPPGEPCRASFILCLDCPCARATPQHLPIQTLVLDQLEARRADLPPAEWTRRFGMPHAQLTNLISQHPPAVAATARGSVTDADRRLVERFLARELDYT